jgi:hypothetical protein
MSASFSLAQWRYRDDKGSIHFVNERAQVPPPYRDKAEKMGHDQGGQVRVAPGARMGAQPGVVSTQQTNPQQNQRAYHPPVMPSGTVSAAGSTGVQSQPDQSAEHLQGLGYARQAAQLLNAAKANINGSPQGTGSTDQTTSAPTSEAQPDPSAPPIENTLKAGGEALAFVSKIMADPRTKKLGQALGSAEAILAIESIIGNPNKLYGLGAVFVWLTIIGMFKWRVDRNNDIGFIKGSLIKFALFLLFVSGAAGISYFVYGNALVVIVKAFVKGFLS